MLTDLLLAGLLLQAPAAVPPPTPPAPAPAVAPAVPALIAAQFEAYQLREQLYLQTLSIERERLDAAVAVALPGFRIDWASKRLVPVKETP